MTTQLTERYLAAATRNAPVSQRDELRRELLERIGYGVDARIHEGATRSTAEYAVLSELGSPDALVADYLDHPQYLIGPSLYQVWKRLARVLFATVVPVASIGVALGQVLAHRSVGEVAAATAVAVLGVTVHLGFWSIFVFAILQRYSPNTALITWTPESLPAITDPPRHQMRADLIANLVFIALIAVGLILSPVLLPPISQIEAGTPVSLFQPGTWAWLQWYLLAVVALDVAFWLALYRHGRWEYTFVPIRLALSAAFTIPVAWVIATGQLFNVAFLTEAGWPDGGTQLAAGGTTAVLVTFVLVGVTFVAAIDGFIKTRHAETRQLAA